MNEIEEAHQRGRTEGQIEAIEKMQLQQNVRLDSHEKRLALQEKITWMLLGAIALIQILPFLQAIMGHN